MGEDMGSQTNVIATAVRGMRPDPISIGGAFLVAALLITFVLTPFTGDIAVFFAAAGRDGRNTLQLRA